MKKLYKKTICMVLCLVMTLSFSATAFANNGKITFGNATVTWNMTSTKSTNTLSYYKKATLRLKGTLCVKNPQVGMTAHFNFNDYDSQTCSFKYNTTPQTLSNTRTFTKFASSNKNNISAYINKNCFTSYKPQP